jgi:hypothetical protein
MKKLLFPILCACAIVFASCKKEEEKPEPTPPTIPTEGMIERWQFDGSRTGSMQASREFMLPTNGDLATPFVADRFGNANKALNVPEDTKYELTNHPFPTGGQARSFSMWVKLDAQNNDYSKIFLAYGSLVSATGVSNGYAVGYASLNTEGKLYNTFYRGGAGLLGSSNSVDYMWMPPTPPTWINIVVTSSNNVQKLYVNGVMRAELTQNLTTASATPAFIGAITGDHIGSFHLDDLISYNRALTQEEITRMANDK